MRPYPSCCVTYTNGAGVRWLKAASGEEHVRAQQTLSKTERDLAQLVPIPFDDKAGRVFDQLRLGKRTRQIGRADLLIASIALANRAVLVTRNLRDFRRIANLQVVNWVD
jgi:tRNA(fMet)-specific endonuclease VapC